MAEEKQWQAGVNTHENVIFTCFGGASKNPKGRVPRAEPVGE